MSLFVPLLFRSSLGEYYKDSRNLKRVKDSSEYLSLTKLRLSGFETSPHVFPLQILTSLAIRFRLLKHTRLNVVAFLNELPKTQHDIASFTIDVNTYTVGFHSVIHLDVFPLKQFIVLILSKHVFHLQNTLLSFTVSGVFKEGELF